MIPKKIKFFISENTEKDAEIMIKNDEDFQSFPKLVSMAVKKYVQDYKNENIEKEWWHIDE
ncbi:MAG: hypothetical protein CVU00_15220 [Bacteroidetes bacterium HGW-Bacteroidetes-17]|nr:MAG: hypothetical protein CVU00_15220 [Bacteroidetes bacterium HGW-Bacteroidetes-17]